jgi:hypothetical protein
MFPLRLPAVRQVTLEGNKKLGFPLNPKYFIGVKIFLIKYYNGDIIYKGREYGKGKIKRANNTT